LCFASGDSADPWPVALRIAKTASTPSKLVLHQPKVLGGMVVMAMVFVVGTRQR
jgi:hypothetical protein